MKNLENIAKLLPLGALFLIICSSVKLIIYFGQFNIKIMEYAELDEVIVSFIDDMLYYSLMFGGFIFVRLWLDNLSKSKLRALLENFKKTSSTKSLNLAQICTKISTFYHRILLLPGNKSSDFAEIIKTTKANATEFHFWYKKNLDELEEISNDKESQRKEVLVNEIHNFTEKLENILSMIEINFTTIDFKRKKRDLLILSAILGFLIVLVLLIPLEYSLKFTLICVIFFFLSRSALEHRQRNRISI